MAVGIVCEWNPFHNGHAYLLEQARAKSGKPIVGVMSGNFVQRGEPSAYPKELRAEWAIRGGADLVLENPFPFSCATAERFAASAVHILAGSGLCDTLAFGCESGSAEEYATIAELLTDKKTEEALKAAVKQQKNGGFAVVREEMVRRELGERFAALVATPNNLLGVEYACAARRQEISLALLPIERIGAEHDAAMPTEQTNGAYASASYLRRRNEAGLYEKYCPAFVAKDLTDCSARRLSERALYASLRSVLLFSSRQGIFDVPIDYEARIVRAARENADFADFAAALKAKHMTDAHLRRMLLFLLFDIKKEALAALPNASVLLAASKDGHALLKRQKERNKAFPQAVTVLPTLSHSRFADERDRARLQKQRDAERLLESLIR